MIDPSPLWSHASVRGRQGRAAGWGLKVRRTMLNGGLQLRVEAAPDTRAAFASSPSLMGLRIDWGCPLRSSRSDHAGAPQRNRVSSRHIRSMTTASLRATAIFAFFSVLRLAIRTPGLDGRPLARRPGQHHMRRGEQCRPRERIPRAADATSHVGLSGLILSWREAQMSADVARASESGRIIDCHPGGQRRHRPHTGNGHEAPA